VKDIVEWCIPVLWPIDVLTLPRRGPRPRLKEETRLRLKVMNDLALPAVDVAPRIMLPRSSVRPDPNGLATGTPTVIPSVYRQVAASTVRNPAAPRNGQLTILMLNDGNGRLATDYWFEGSRQVRYIALNGASIVIPIESLDVEATADINRRRGVPFLVRTAETY
jgi:hypothetical protein